MNNGSGRIVDNGQNGREIEKKEIKNSGQNWKEQEWAGWETGGGEEEGVGSNAYRDILCLPQWACPGKEERNEE